MSKKQGTSSNQEDSDMQLGCIEPGCQSKKTFKSINSLMSHILAAHKKKYSPKQLEDILKGNNKQVEQPKSKEEVSNMATEEKQSQQTQVDIGKLLERMDQIDKKIPENLCEEFPNLCKLGGRVDELTKEVGTMKDNQLKKLVLQVPKTEDKAAPVDLSPVNTKLEILNNSVIDLTGKVEKVVKEDKPQVKVTKEDTKAEKSHGHGDEGTTPRSDIVEKAVRTVKEELSKDQLRYHTVNEVINCPECREKLFKKLEEDVKKQDFKNPVFVDFMKQFSFIKDEKGAISDARKDEQEAIERDVSGSVGSDITGQGGQSHESSTETNINKQRTEVKSGTSGSATGSQETGTGKDEGGGAGKEGQEGTGEPTTTTTAASKSATSTAEGESTSEPAANGPRTCRLLFRK